MRSVCGDGRSWRPHYPSPTPPHPLVSLEQLNSPKLCKAGTDEDVTSEMFGNGSLLSAACVSEEDGFLAERGQHL